MIILSVLLFIVTFILTAALLILLMILLIPFGYAARGVKYETFRLEAGVSWLFGLLGAEFLLEGGRMGASIRLLFFRFPVRLAGRKPEAHAEKKKREKKNEKKGNNLRLFWDMGKKLLRHAAPNQVDIEGRIGFDEPHQTGMLCSFLALRDVLPEQWSLRLQPDFNEEVLEGRASVEGRVVLIVPALIALSTYMKHRKTRNRGLIEKESV